MSKNKHLCPCGSGKRAKLCCRPSTKPTKFGFTSSEKLELREAAEALAAKGKHQEASDILERLVMVSPHNPLIWNDLGIQYEAAGRTDEAFTALRRGHQADSTYPPILYNLGKFTLDRFIRLYQNGELTEGDAEKLLTRAIQFLNANLDRDPENADAHYNLAIAYAFCKDEHRAKAHMEVAVRLSSEYEAPRGWLTSPGV
jgi:tetratricopeptide (TPR) repeat protein